ncbi:TPA: AAA family ATPase, partial [Escherichia coli]|nr:AAA family ATPase [Escherichia coli]
MLLRFEAENHLSLRDHTEFSLIASSLKDNEEGLIERSEVARSRILPSAVIYGANASGKSNLLSAFKYMCSLVESSHSRGRPDGGVRQMPFLLGPNNESQPTKFAADFIASNTRYRYGFEYTGDAFTSEWLFAYPNGRAQLLFERNSQEFNFGRGLRGRNQTIADLTRRNSLFVSAAAQNDHQELLPVYRFFKSVIFNQSISVGRHHASSELK